MFLHLKHKSKISVSLRLAIFKVLFADGAKTKDDNGADHTGDGKELSRDALANLGEHGRETGEKAANEVGVAERARGEKYREELFVSDVSDVEGARNAELHDQDEDGEDELILVR